MPKKIHFKQFSLAKASSSNVKKKFYLNQFSLLSTHFSSIWLLIWPLSGVTTLCQSGLGNNGNERVPRIPQSSSTTETSVSDCLVSYLGHRFLSLIPLQRCSRNILQPQPTGQVCECIYIYIYTHTPCLCLSVSLSLSQTHTHTHTHTHTYIYIYIYIYI